MVGNRLSTRSTTQIWSASSTTVARATPDGTLMLYPVASIHNPARHALAPRPTALCLRPRSASRERPPYLAATHTGQLFFPRLVATLPAAVVALDYLPTVAVAISASELAVLDPVTKSLLSTHTVRHASPLTCVALTSPTHAVVASQLLSLVDLSTGDIVRQYSGHKNPVVAAVSLPQQRLVTAASDKFLSVWDVTPDIPAPSRKRRRTTPSPSHRTLIAPDPVLALAAHHHDDDVTIASICSTASVAVWRRYTDSKEPQSPTFIIRSKEHDPAPSIFVSTFTENSNLTILYGNAFGPSVHSVALDSKDDQVLPPAIQNVITKDSQVQVPNKAQSKLDLAEKSMAVEVSAIPVAPERRRTNGKIEDIEKGGNEDVVDDEEADKDEPTLQEKLATLGIAPDMDMVGVNSTPMTSSTPVRLDSRVSVLLQAIRSKDSQLLDSCIANTTQRSIVRRTIELVPSDIAVNDLLHLLVHRLQRYPRRADELIVWIREVLIQHASMLISQQDNDALRALMAIIDTRTRALDALSRLEGRLELIVGQAERISRLGAVDLENMAPKAEYIEQEQSEEESSDEEEEDDDDGDDDDDEESNSSAESGSGEDEQEEDETRDFSNSADGSSEEESDEEMEDAIPNGNVEVDDVKTNGGPKINSVESDSESDDESDEGG